MDWVYSFIAGIVGVIFIGLWVVLIVEAVKAERILAQRENKMEA